MIKQLGLQVASEGRQRAEERRGRTEAERRLRAEKQVSSSGMAHGYPCSPVQTTPHAEEHISGQDGSIRPIWRVTNRINSELRTTVSISLALDQSMPRKYPTLES